MRQRLRIAPILPPIGGAAHVPEVTTAIHDFRHIATV
jgi:hypothetical protein